jgi:hypothetical protein
LSRSSKSETVDFEVIKILGLNFFRKLHRRSSYSTLSSYFRPSELFSYSRSSYLTSSYLKPSYLTSSYLTSSYLTSSCLTSSNSTSSKFDSCRLNYPTVLFTILLLLLLFCFLVQWKILQFLLMQKVTILDSRCPIISIRTKFMFVATNTTATLKNPIKQLNSYKKIRPNTYNYKCQPPTRAHSRSDYYFALTKQSGVIVGQHDCSLTVTKTRTFTTTLLRRKLYTHPTQKNGKLRRRKRTTSITPPPGEKHQATRLSQFGHNFGQYSGLQSSTSAYIDTGLLLRRFTITTKLIRNLTTMMIKMKANYYYILSEPLVQFLFPKISQKFLFKNIYSFRLSFSPFYTHYFLKKSTFKDALYYVHDIF